MMLFGIYTGNSPVNHTGICVCQNDIFATFDFDPKLQHGKADEIVMTKYNLEDVQYFENLDNVYDFTLKVDERYINVKIIKTLRPEFPFHLHELILHMDDYNLLENNCRVHVCKTIKFIDDLYPNEINFEDCWNVILKSAGKNYQKMLTVEKMICIIYNFFPMGNHDLNLDDFSVFVDKTVMYYCLKNYSNVLFLDSKPEYVRREMKNIRRDIEKYQPIDKSLMYAIVRIMFNYTEMSYSWIKSHMFGHFNFF